MMYILTLLSLVVLSASAIAGVTFSGGTSSSGGVIMKSTNDGFTVACDPSPAVAPCDPVGTRTVVVNGAIGSSSPPLLYKTIQEALDAVEPGDVIRIRAGTYDEANVINGCSSSCGGSEAALWQTWGNLTEETAVTIEAYPGESPVLIGSLILKGVRNVIIQNLEMKNASQFLQLVEQSNANNEQSQNITIRDNYIHDNQEQGMFFRDTKDIYVVGNHFKNNGTWDSGTAPCYSPQWGSDYSHCHGIYVSIGPSLSGIDRARMAFKRNIFEANAGSGIQLYSHRTDKFEDILIENNVFLDHNQGIYFWDTRNSIVRNNTFIQRSNPIPPSSGYSPHVYSFLQVWRNDIDNEIYNNAMYTSLTDAQAQYTSTNYVLDFWSKSDNCQTWDYNAYFNLTNRGWRWGGHDDVTFTCHGTEVVEDIEGCGNGVCGEVQTNFTGNYPTTAQATPWNLDDNGVFGDTSAHGFTNVSGGTLMPGAPASPGAAVDPRLEAASPMVDAGHPTLCATVDFFGVTRAGRGSGCDIGAFER